MLRHLAYRLRRPIYLAIYALCFVWAPPVIAQGNVHHGDLILEDFSAGLSRYWEDKSNPIEHRSMTGFHLNLQYLKVRLSASPMHRELTGTTLIPPDRWSRLFDALEEIRDIDPNAHSKKALILADLASQAASGMATMAKPGEIVQTGYKLWQHTLREARQIGRDKSNLKPIVARQIVRRALAQTSWITEECRKSSPSEMARVIVESATEAYLQHPTLDLDHLGILLIAANCTEDPRRKLKLHNDRVQVADVLDNPYAIVRSRIDLGQFLLWAGRKSEARQRFSEALATFRIHRSFFVLPDHSAETDFVIPHQAFKPLYDLGFRQPILELISEQHTKQPRFILLLQVAHLGEMALLERMAVSTFRVINRDEKTTDADIARELQHQAALGTVTATLTRTRLLRAALNIAAQTGEKELRVSLLTDLAKAQNDLGDFELSEKYARMGLKLSRQSGLGVSSKLSDLWDRARREMGNAGTASRVGLSSLARKLDGVCHQAARKISIRELPRLPVIELISNPTYAQEFVRGTPVAEYIRCAQRAGFKKSSSGYHVDQGMMTLIALRNDHAAAKSILDRLLRRPSRSKQPNRNVLTGFNDAAWGLILAGRGEWLRPYVSKIRKLYSLGSVRRQLNEHHWLPIELGRTMLVVGAFGTNSDVDFFARLARRTESHGYAELAYECDAVFAQRDCGFLKLITQRTFGDESLNNTVLLGRLLENMGHLKLARHFLLPGSISTKRTLQGPLELAHSSTLARVYLKLGDNRAARETVVPIIRSVQQKIAEKGLGATAALRWAGRQRELYLTYMSALSSSLALGHTLGKQDKELAFASVQFLQLTQTAVTFAQLSARMAAQSGSTARQHQDLSRQLVSRYEQLTSSSEKQVVDEITTLERKLTGLTSQLRQGDPTYFDHGQLQILKMQEVQNSLRDGEAMLSLYAGPEYTYLWWIDRTEAVLARTSATTAQLSQAITELRRGLDPTEPRPFEMKTAHWVFKELFSHFQSGLARSTRLIFVPHGPFDSLPLSVLLRQPTKRDTFTLGEILKTEPDWLIRSHSIQVLPAMATVRILRQEPRRSLPQSWSYFGLANPNFRNLTSSKGSVSGAQPDFGRFSPLPETEKEITEIRSAFPQSRAASLLIGNAANETELRLQDLQAFDVISIATHAVVSDEVRGLSEPALVLTPQSRDDRSSDGLLTAREITDLKLDAELVMLSACNTAAGDGTPGAEGLSGLAKAFFYAGSRNLLVTHWTIASEPAVDLAVGMMRARLQGKEENWASALRRATLSYIEKEKGSPWNHPAIWGAHTIVGAT